MLCLPIFNLLFIILPSKGYLCLFMYLFYVTHECFYCICTPDFTTLYIIFVCSWMPIILSSTLTYSGIIDLSNNLEYLVDQTLTLFGEYPFSKTTFISIKQLYWKETPAKVFSYEFCDIFKKTYFMKHLQMHTAHCFCLYKKYKKV